MSSACSATWGRSSMGSSTRSRRRSISASSIAMCSSSKTSSPTSTSPRRSRRTPCMRTNTRCFRRSPGRCSLQSSSTSRINTMPSTLRMAARARVTTRCASRHRSSRSIPILRLSRRCASGISRAVPMRSPMRTSTAFRCPRAQTTIPTPSTTTCGAVRSNAACSRTPGTSPRTTCGS